MSSFDSSKIYSALDKLRSNGATVFGSEDHGFHLKPPLPEPEIFEFEKAHRVTLPVDFRDFLIHVGNGGAGPFYGIFPLGQTDDNFGFKRWQENDSLVGTLAEPFLLEDAWNDLIGMPNDELAENDEDEYSQQMDIFESNYWRTQLVNGSIPICHEGCALRIWLVVTGPQKGFLWRDRRSEYGGIQPVLLSDSTPATFRDWYEEWLSLSIRSQIG